MKTQRIEKRTRTTAMVAILAMAVLLATAVPALALEGIGLDEPVRKYTPADEMLVIEGLYLGELELHVPEAEDEDADAPIPDGGDWEMVPQDDGPFPDGGFDEMVPEEQQVPDDGADEQAPEDQQVPDDGTDEPGDEPDDSSESTPTPDVPEDEGDEDDIPSLPFTGGNAIGFAIAGIFILLAGVLVLGRGLTARS